MIMKKQSDMTRQEIEDGKNVLYSTIKDREAKLKETDYVAAKIAEGAATAEEYSDILAKRREWRKVINAAEDAVRELEARLAALPEPETPLMTMEG